MSISGHIEIGPDLRPCYVDGRRALFHKWAIEDGVCMTATTVRGGLMVTAIVEFENGKIERVDPDLLQFTDSLYYMAEYHWPNPEELQHEET